MQYECVYEFVEPFKSYCHQHYATNTINTAAVHDDSEICGICRKEMSAYSAVNSIQTICCNSHTWYHKLCLKSTAFAFADDFDCPSCGNKDDFQNNMALNGVYIPKSDYLPNYIGDNAVDEENVESQDEIIQKSKRRRIHKNWSLEKTFRNKNEAIKAVESEQCWAYYYANESSTATRITYRCNAMKFRGKQCDAGVYLSYDKRNSDVQLYRCELPHSHDSEACKQNVRNTIPIEIEAAIRELFNHNVKPKAILYNLVLKGHQPPSKARLTTLLTKLRKEKYGEEKLNFGTLQKWLIESSNVPDDECEPFIVNYDVHIDEADDSKNEFRFFISSKLLLQNGIRSNNTHSDATYKLMWQGFPVLIIGFSDRNRKFHPTGISVSTNERTADFKFLFSTIKNAIAEIFGEQFKPNILICDAADSIKNGFKQVFGDTLKIVMCWAHVRRNVSKNLSKFISDKKKQAIFMSELDKLQLSRSPQIFETASKLFIDKWETVSKDLVKYFKDEWLVKNPNWYEGYAVGAPSTNNALEATNRVIKDEQTFRERLDLSQLRIVLFNMITQWSREYVEKLNMVNFGYPDIDLKWWTAGYQFARSNVTIITAKRGYHTTYKIHLADDDECIENHNDWSTFRDYKSSLGIVSVVFKNSVTTENWQSGTCNCENFLKKYICEHLIGVALRLKCATAPIEAKSIPIGQKRKRGRPAKSKPALEMQ